LLNFPEKHEDKTDKGRKKNSYQNSCSFVMCVIIFFFLHSHILYSWCRRYFRWR